MTRLFLVMWGQWLSLSACLLLWSASSFIRQEIASRNKKLHYDQLSHQTSTRPHHHPTFIVEVAENKQLEDAFYLFASPGPGLVCLKVRSKTRRNVYLLNSCCWHRQSNVIYRCEDIPLYICLYSSGGEVYVGILTVNYHYTARFNLGECRKYRTSRALNHRHHNTE